MKVPTPLYLIPFYGSGIHFFGAYAGTYVLLKGKSGPQTKVNSMFQEIKSFVEKDQQPAWIWTALISETMWQTIDHRALIRKDCKSQCNIVRRLSCRIAKEIKADRKQRTKNAGEAIEYMLEKDNLNADGRGSKLSHDDLDKLEAGYTNIYRRENTPGESVPILVTPFDLDDNVPLEGEIADTVRRMRNGKAG
jgi:hypothetical protein